MSRHPLAPVPTRAAAAAVLIVALAVAAAPTASAQPANLQRIFVAGDPIPTKTGGETFGFCPNGNHALNDRGDVAFIWCIQGTGADAVFLREGDGTWTILAETDAPAPGIPGALFGSNFDDLRLNDAGDVMFTGILQQGPGVTSDDNQVVWLWRDGVLTPVAREGMQAPGTAAGELFTGNVQPLLGRRGGAGFTWAARDPGGPLATPGGLWGVAEDLSVHLVVRQEQPAPGYEPDEEIGTFRGRRVIGSGSYLYAATVAPLPGVSAIWVEDVDAGTATRVAANGTAVADQGGATLAQLQGGRVVNFGGDLGFRTGLNGGASNGAVIVADGGVALRTAVTQGQTAPGTSGTFNSMTNARFALNAQGEVALVANTDVGTSGLWTDVGGTLHAIAVEGQPAPGFGSDVYEGFFQFAGSGLHLNDRGEILFVGLVSGDLHLFHAAANGTVSLVLERGSDFEMTPGEIRELTGIQVQRGEETQDLPVRSFNTAGRLLVRLSFENTTRSGLWLSDPQATTSDPISHAALGDSYSSGEGAPPYFAGTDTATNRCRRSTGAYATLLRTPGNDRPLAELAQLLPSSFEQDFLACSGAVSKNVRAAGEGLYGEPPQLDPANAVDAGRDLVTISIGGNDAQFANILALCLIADACHELEPFEPLTELTFAELFPLIAAYGKAEAQTVHAEIRAATPNAPTLVVGYPQVLGGRECPAVRFPFVPDVTLSVEEQAFLRDATTQLNGLLAQSAAEVGLHWISPEAHFAGHGVCGTFDDWIHGILPFEKNSSFHPTVRGQQELARVVNAYLDGVASSGWPTGFFPTGLPRNPDPSSLAPGPARAPSGEPTPTLGDLQATADPAPPCDAEGIFTPGQTVRVAGGEFAAAASVAVRLRVAGLGAPLAAGTLTADGAGAIDDVVTLPSGFATPAVATLEALGAGAATNGGGPRLLVDLVRIEDSFATDGDLDGLPDLCDPCPATPGADPVAAAADADGDGLGDACDACPADFENDGDGDGLCAAVDPCPADAGIDVDDDGRCAGADNCPLTFNPGQLDADGDGVGDACADAVCHPVAVALRPAEAGGEIDLAASNCGLDSWYAGTPLTLTASAVDGGMGGGGGEPAWQFTGWTGDATSATNPLDVTVDGPLQLVANFCTDPTDGDGDLVADLCDNCPSDANDGQADGDADTAGDACDCAPADPTLRLAPGEVAGLGALPDKASLVWTSLAPQAGSAVVYDVARGALGGLPVGSGAGAGAETCVASGAATPDALDGATPDPGEGYWYLVRGRSACGAGTWGADGEGQERVATVCP